MSAMAKDELLTELYSLRATLSAISVEKDALDKARRDLDSAKESADNEKDAINEKITEHKKVVTKQRNTIAAYDNKQDNINAEYRKKTLELDERRSLAKKSKAGYAGKVILGILTGPVSLAIGAVCGYFFWYYWISGADMPDLFFLLDLLLVIFALVSPLLALAGLVGTVLFPVLIIKNTYKIEYSEKKLDKDKHLAQLSRDNKLANLQRDYDAAPAIIEQEKKEIEKLNAQTATIADRLKEEESKYTVRASTRLANYEAISDHARKHYAEVLRESDWGNLDLVIYYIETNRAESIKEALQLVDRQRQTDEIVGAIHGAARTISDTISVGFTQLQSNMVKCFALISDQITAVAVEQSKRLNALSGAINDMQGSISSSIGQLASSINVQNALTAKANVSSEQLVSDMHYMRNLAENAEIRRRNS